MPHMAVTNDGRPTSLQASVPESETAKHKLFSCPRNPRMTANQGLLQIDSNEDYKEKKGSNLKAISYTRVPNDLDY